MDTKFRWIHCLYPIAAWRPVLNSSCLAHGLNRQKDSAHRKTTHLYIGTVHFQATTAGHFSSAMLFWVAVSQETTFDAFQCDDDRIDTTRYVPRTVEAIESDVIHRFGTNTLST